MTQSNKKLQIFLYVESDKLLALELKGELEKAGYWVHLSTDYTEATEWLCAHQNHPVDTMIIDLPKAELPRQQNAFKLCAFLRKGGIVTSRNERFHGWGHRVPLLLLMPKEERSKLEERLTKEALLPEQSQDKPIKTAVLLGKLQALVQPQARGTADPATAPIYIRSLAINLQNRTALLNGAPLDLTMKEFDLLVYMAVRPNVTLNREQLLKAIWGEAYNPRNVDVYIGKLRKKLENSDCAKLLVRGRNGGYLFQTTQSTKVTRFAEGMDDTTEPEVVGATLAQSAMLILLENQPGLEREILLQDVSTLDPTATGIKIGRQGAKCHVVIADKRVSREHAMIEEKNGQFYLVDTDSTGGTFLSRDNATTIRLKPNTPVLLKNGDLIYFNVLGYRFELFDFLVD